MGHCRQTAWLLVQLHVDLADQWLLLVQRLLQQVLVMVEHTRFHWELQSVTL
jgi:hypothetical protein